MHARASESPGRRVARSRCSPTLAHAPHVCLGTRSRSPRCARMPPQHSALREVMDQGERATGGPRRARARVPARVLQVARAQGGCRGRAGRRSRRLREGSSSATARRYAKNRASPSRSCAGAGRCASGPPCHSLWPQACSGMSPARPPARSARSARARRRDGAGWHCRAARQAGDRAGRAPRVEVLAVEAAPQLPHAIAGDWGGM